MESAAMDVDVDARPAKEDTAARYVRDRFIFTNRRGLTAAGVVLAAALLYWYLCWIQSSATLGNSDAANISLQGWDLWHGNPMLRDWITGDANFYTFETPLYAIVERVMGLRSTTIHVVAALTYTLVMLATAWLVKGDERGLRAWARFGIVAAFLAFPLFDGYLTATLVDPPDHIGTAVFILLGYLLCDRASGRRGATWCLFALLVLGQLGDATVKYVTVIPIVLVCVSRPLLARRLRSPDLWMAFAAAASVPGEAILRAAMRTWGAYSMVPPKTKMADSSVWLNHLHTTLINLLTLFNIPTSTPNAPFWPFAAVLGAIVLLAGLYGFVRTLLRWPRAAAADQLLAVGIPVYLAAYAFSTMVSPGGAYEFLGVVPMIVALAVRNLPLPELRQAAESGRSRRLPALVAAAGVTAVAVLATGIKPGMVSEQERIAAWLKAHGLTYGISQYWDASSVTVDSGDKVGVAAVVPLPANRYGVYVWVTRTTWYDPAQRDARFFIANNGVPGYRIADAEAAFGKPAAIYHVGDSDIMVYRTNLLRTVVQAQPPDF